MKVNQNPYHDQGMHKGAPANSFIKTRNLRLNMSTSEKKLWELLKDKRFQGYKFRRQHPIHIYIVDFYCHELGLIIEVDGEYHNDPLQISKDLERSDLLKFQDLHIIRFTNDQVLNSIGNVLNDLKQYIIDIFPPPKEN